jgi:hypothetical protein
MQFVYILRATSEIVLDVDAGYRQHLRRTAVQGL